MFNLIKPVVNHPLDLDERFKDEAASDIKKQLAARKLKQEGIINTVRTPSLGEPASSSFYNNFSEDTKFNIHNLYSQSLSLIDDFDRTKNEADKAFRFLLKQSDSLAAEFKETQIKQTLNYKSLIHFNSFTRDIDLQFVPATKSFLLQDPLTLTTYKSKYAMKVIPNNGLGLPIKKSIVLPLINITRDHSDSQWGQSLIEETDPNLLLDNGVYKLVFLDRDQDALGNVYKRSQIYKVSLWCEFGGIQTTNRLEIDTHSNMKVIGISYLDQNENELAMEFDQFYSNGRISVTFDILTTRAIKITLGLVSSTETTLFQQEFGRIYSFSVMSIRGFLDTFFNTGYFLSHPRQLDRLTGVKIKSLASLSIGFKLDTYLKIEYRDTLGNLLKTASVPILEEYDKDQLFSLYFLNKQARLFYYPQNTLILYKDGKELEAGVDYWFFTNVDSTLVDTIPDLDDFSSNVLYIKLDKFESNARYTASYKPHPSGKVLNTYTYSNDTLAIRQREKGSYKVYLFHVIRQIDTSVTELPNIASYVLELYYTD